MTPEESKTQIDGLAVEASHAQVIRPLLISVVDAAKVLGITRRSFDTHVVSRLATVRIGSRRLVPTAELDRYVAGLIAEAEAVATVERPIPSNMADQIRRIDEHIARAKQPRRSDVA